MNNSKAVYWADKAEVDGHNEAVFEAENNGQQAYELIKIALDTVKAIGVCEDNATLEAATRIVKQAMELLDDANAGVHELMIWPKAECEGYRTVPVEEIAAREKAESTVEDWLQFPNAARAELEELEQLAKEARKAKEASGEEAEE